MILKQDESGKGYLKDKVFEKKEALLRFTNLLSICNQEKKVSKNQMSSTKPKQIHRFTKSTSIMFHRTVQQDNRHEVIRFMETVNY